MSNLLRRRVSQNRKRLVEGRYDLDLTYICENIIAMGYPSDKAIQSLIRNQIEKVSKFLKEKHENSFKIFNLCLESDYNFLHFDNMVQRIPIEDHNPPKFIQILEFCSEVDKWLKEKTSNVAIVHCKAGKGRTGTMISCYFLYSQMYSTPFEAMDEFSKRRCIDSKGVTIPSQRRFVEYYDDYLKNNRTYEHVEFELKSIKITQPLASPKEFFKALSFQVFKDSINKLYDSHSVKVNPTKNSFLFEIDQNVLLSGDIKFSFYDKKKECVFCITFNTYCFVQENENTKNDLSCLGTKFTDKNGDYFWILKKKDIDLAYKDKAIDPELEVEFKFKPILNPTKTLADDSSTAKDYTIEIIDGNVQVVKALPLNSSMSVDDYSESYAKRLFNQTNSLELKIENGKIVGCVDASNDNLETKTNKLNENFLKSNNVTTNNCNCNGKKSLSTNFLSRLFFRRKTNLIKSNSEPNANDEKNLKNSESEPDLLSRKNSKKKFFKK